MGGVEDLLDGDAALLRLIAEVLGQLEDGIAGDAGEDGAVEHRGDDLAVDDEHHVHGADFLDVLLLHAVQPQHLRVALFLGDLAGADGGRVVAAGLGKADAAAHGADVLVLHVDVHRGEAAGVVRARGREDDVELVGVRRMHAEHGVHGNDGGADVERRALRVGYPVLLDLEKLFKAGHGHIFIKLRNGHALGGAVHAREIVAGAEKLQAAVLAAIALHALEDLLAVVQNGRGRIHGEVVVRHHAGIVPALFHGIVHFKHVVGKELAKAHLALVLRLLLEGSRLFKANVLHGRPSVSENGILESLYARAGRIASGRLLF